MPTWPTEGRCRSELLPPEAGRGAEGDIRNMAEELCLWSGLPGAAVWQVALEDGTLLLAEADGTGMGTEERPHL